MINIITYYDILPGKEKEYEEFVKNVAGAVMKKLPPGIQPERVWNLINNNRIYSLMSIFRPATLDKLLENEDRRNLIKTRNSNKYNHRIFSAHRA